MPIASAPPRGLCGWPPRHLLPVECRLYTCEYSYSSFHFTILTPLSQCSGETHNGQDFDAFVGVEKAKEIHGLFSSWIDAIFRTYYIVSCRSLALILIRTLFS